MFEFNDGDYILGYWIAADEYNNNWYCYIKRSADGKWEGAYTFRYSKSADAWDGKDEKKCYGFKQPTGEKEENILQYMESIFSRVKATYNKFSDHFLVQGDIKKFLEIAKTKDYIHMKTFQ